MALLTEEQLAQIQASLLGRVNLRPRSITGDKLARNLQSTNFSDSAGSEAGWRINFDGSAEFYSLSVIASIEGGTIDIGGADATSFHVDSAGNMWLGHADYASAPFKVSSAGALSAASGTFGGALDGATGTFEGALSAATGTFEGTLNAVDGTFTGALSGGTIDIGGDDATSFHVDSTGRMWMGAGNSGYSSAPFRVDAGGNMRFDASAVITFAQAGNGYDANAYGTISLNSSGQLQLGGFNAGLYLWEENSLAATTAWYDFGDGGVLMYGSSDPGVAMRDTAASSITKYVSFQDSGGGNDGLVGMVSGELQVRQYESNIIRFMTNNLSRGLIQSDGVLKWWGSAESTSGYDPSPLVAKFELNGSGSEVLVWFHNHVALSTNDARCVAIAIGANNTTNPDTGDHYITFERGDGTNLDAITGDGSGGVRFTGEAQATYSDIRLKSNIRPPDTDEQWAALCRQLRTFEMKTSHGVHTRTGVVAQWAAEEPSLRGYVEIPDESVFPEKKWKFEYESALGMIAHRVMLLEERLAA